MCLSSLTAGCSCLLLVLLLHLLFQPSKYSCPYTLRSPITLPKCNILNIPETSTVTERFFKRFILEIILKPFSGFSPNHKDIICKSKNPYFLCTNIDLRRHFFMNRSHCRGAQYCAFLLSVCILKTGLPLESLR